MMVIRNGSAVVLIEMPKRFPAKLPSGKLWAPRGLKVGAEGKVVCISFKHNDVLVKFRGSGYPISVSPGEVIRKEEYKHADISNQII